jgi:hypothetical protein
VVEEVVLQDHLQVATLAEEVVAEVLGAQLLVELVLPILGVAEEELVVTLVLLLVVQVEKV